MTLYTELPFQQIELAKTDQAAFIALYQHYSQRVLRFLIARTGNLQLAEDLAQETFVLVMQKLPQYQDKGAKFSSWLLQVALNCLRMHWRKHKNTTTVELETIQELWPAQTDYHTEWMDFFLALQKLSDEEQTLLTLKYVEGQSNQDIATLLNISTNHCGVKLHRVLERLQTYL